TSGTRHRAAPAALRVSWCSALGVHDLPPEPRAPGPQMKWLRKILPKREAAPKPESPPAPAALPVQEIKPLAQAFIDLALAIDASDEGAIRMAQSALQDRFDVFMVGGDVLPALAAHDTKSSSIESLMSEISRRALGIIFCSVECTK